MLHAGLDLSRKKLDVCLLSEQGEHLDQLAVAPDADSLRTLARRIAEVHGEPVCAVIESMTGARIVHDTLEQEGWAVEIADAQKVKGPKRKYKESDKTLSGQRYLDEASMQKKLKALNSRMVATGLRTKNHCGLPFNAEIGMEFVLKRRDGREIVIKLQPYGCEWNGESYSSFSSAVGNALGSNKSGYDVFNFNKRANVAIRGPGVPGGLFHSREVGLR